MEEFFNSKIGKVLRWALLLPCSMTAFVLSIAIASLIIYISWETSQYYEEMWYHDVIRIIFSNGVGGFCFVLSGTYIAPKYQAIVSIVLATIFILLNIMILSANFSLGIVFSDNQFEGWIDILAILTSIIGAGWACLLFLNGEFLTFNKQSGKVLMILVVATVLGIILAITIAYSDEYLCDSDDFEFDENGRPLYKVDCILENNSLDLKSYLEGKWVLTKKKYYENDLGIDTSRWLAREREDYMIIKSDTCFNYIDDKLSSFNVIKVYIKDLDLENYIPLWFDGEFTGWFDEKECNACDPCNPHSVHEKINYNNTKFSCTQAGEFTTSLGWNYWVKIIDENNINMYDFLGIEHYTRVQINE